jgi:hypothetical protein
MVAVSAPGAGHSKFSFTPKTAVNLVHEILQIAVGTLDASGGLGQAEPQAIKKAVGGAVAAVASR